MFDFITTLNGGILAGMTVVAVVALIVTRRRDSGATMAHRMSVRARLPFGSESVALGVRRRALALHRGNMWGLLITVGVAFIVFAVTPLSASPFFLWIVTLMIFLGVLTGSSLVVTLKERLFAPAPTAIRIARAHPMALRDYLGPRRRLIPDVLSIAAVVAVGALIVTQILRGVDTLAATIAYVSLGLAMAFVVATRAMERAVLNQPQPASNTLELAWDDLFRVDTLSTLRLGAASAVWLPLGLALTLLMQSWLLPSTDSADIAGLFPWWGVPVLQLLYALTQGRLPDALYPDFLATPGFVTESATQASTAAERT